MWNSCCWQSTVLQSTSRDYHSQDFGHSFLPVLISALAEWGEICHNEIFQLSLLSLKIKLSKLDNQFVTCLWTELRFLQQLWIFSSSCERAGWVSTAGGCEDWEWLVRRSLYTTNTRPNLGPSKDTPPGPASTQKWAVRLLLTSSCPPQPHLEVVRTLLKKGMILS